MACSGAPFAGPTLGDHAHTSVPAREVDDDDETRRKKRILEADSLRDLLTEKEQQLYDRVLRRIGDDDKWQSRPFSIPSSMQEVIRNAQKTESILLQDFQQTKSAAAPHELKPSIDAQVKVEGKCGIVDSEQGREAPGTLYTHEISTCSPLLLSNGEQNSEDDGYVSSGPTRGWIKTIFRSIGHALGSGLQLIGDQFEETATDEALDEAEFGNPRRRIRAMRRALEEATARGLPPPPELPELHPHPPPPLWRLVMLLTAGSLVSIFLRKKTNGPRVVLKASLLSVREGRRISRRLWPPGAWTRRSSTAEADAVRQSQQAGAIAGKWESLHSVGDWQRQSETEPLSEGSVEALSPDSTRTTLAPSLPSSPLESGAASASCSSTPFSEDGALSNHAQESGQVSEERSSKGASTVPLVDVSSEAEQFILNVLRGLPPPET